MPSPCTSLADGAVSLSPRGLRASQALPVLRLERAARRNRRRAAPRRPPSRHMPPKKKPKQSFSSDVESAEAAIAGKGWERSLRWKVVKARPRADDGGVTYYTLSYYCYKSRRDRMAKKSPTQKLITTSMVPGCPARWRTHNEANLAMAKYVAVVEEARKAGRKRSAGGDEGDVAAINAHRAGKQYPVTTSGVDVGQAWIKVQEQQGVAQPTKDMPPLKKNVPAGYWDNAVDICAVGLWHMNPGANKEGWWLGVHIIVHTYDVIQAFEFVYGKLSDAATPCQALFYFDHSAQHGHSKPDALSTTQMNLSWGGDQPIVRDTIIERSEGFLGPFEPMLKPGDTQRGYFDDPLAPPVDDPAAPPGNGRRAINCPHRGTTSGNIHDAQMMHLASAMRMSAAKVV